MIWIYINLLLLTIILVLPMMHYRLYRKGYHFSVKLYKLREVRSEALMRLQDYILDPKYDYARKEEALEFVNKLTQSSFLLDRMEGRLFSWRTFAESFGQVYEAFNAVRRMKVEEPWLAQIKHEYECKTATVFRALPLYRYRLLALCALRIRPLFALLGLSHLQDAFYSLQRAVRLCYAFFPSEEQNLCSSR